METKNYSSDEVNALLQLSSYIANSDLFPHLTILEIFAHIYLAKENGHQVDSRLTEANITNEERKTK